MPEDPRRLCVLDYFSWDLDSTMQEFSEELAEFLVWIESQDLEASTFQSRLQHLTSARTNQFFIERHALLNFRDIRDSVQGVYNDLVAAEQALELHCIP